MARTTGDLKPQELKAELRAYLDHAAAILLWADPKFWLRLRHALPPPPPLSSSSPDLTAMSQSTTLHSLQSYPSSTHYQDPELIYGVGGPRYHHTSNPRTALLYSPLTIDPVAGTCRNSGGGGTLYTLQSVRGGGIGGGGGGQTYYATSTTNSRGGGTAISHIYQVVE
jgi:hypothetical protein